jgi:uncharacterized protein (DUF2267 family)
MDNDLLIEHVKWWGGIAGKRDAERAIVAALRALREAMFDDEADAIARELPAHLAHSMRIHPQKAVVNATDLYQRAARYEGVPVRVALEHVQAVCQALASCLPPPSIQRLSRALPNLAELFIVPDRGSHPATVLSPHGRTMAEGHPGSDHPISEAAPQGTGRSRSPVR